MIGALTRRSGRECLSGGGLFGHEPTRPAVDDSAALRRRRLRERLYSEPPPLPVSRYMSDPRYIVGLACPVETLSNGKPDEEGRRRRVRFDVDAFDPLLWEVHRGLFAVGLWLRHNESRAIGDTADGTFLRLLRGERGLMIVVDTETARGSIVAGLLRTRPDEFGELSIGCRHEEFTDYPQMGGTVVRHVHLATVREVSLVPAGSMPGTWIR